MSDLVAETPIISHKRPYPVDKKQPDSKSKSLDSDQPKSAPEKGQYELFIFTAAIVTGTACSIFAKVLYGLQGIGMNGNIEFFDKPLFQALAMFTAMVIGIPLHWIVVAYRIPFPGYQHPVYTKDNAIIINLVTSTREERMKLVSREEEQETNANTATGIGLPIGYGSTPSCKDPTNMSLPARTYWVLALLSMFDLTATALCAIGLLYLDISVYQLLRGSCIIFVALLRQYGLKQHLFRFQWIGVLYNVLSVVLVGTAALRNATATSFHGKTEEDKETTQDVLFGVAFMLTGTLVQAMQFALEEKIMVHDEVKVPPLMLFGMEGVWGVIFSLFLLYPIGYALPGQDNGHYEDFFNTMAMLWNTPSLQLVVAFYMLSIFGYNLFAVLVTFSLSSIWHSILDNFRPMTVWGVDLILYGSTGGSFGEAWTSSSWIELTGLGVLLYGTAIFNAPDAGSIQLKGEWFSLGLDFQNEYTELSAQRMFTTGSYPSLHRFLSGSVRGSLQDDDSQISYLDLSERL